MQRSATARASTGTPGFEQQRSHKVDDDVRHFLLFLLTATAPASFLVLRNGEVYVARRR